jgi:fermentation-respiration switch protein FrsA (DUF1100 family)
MKLLLALLLVLAAGPVSAAEQVENLARPDGSLIHYTLDHPPGRSAGMLVLAQGSSCLPGAARASLARLRAAFPDHTALIVEKAGITPDAAIADGHDDCPEAYRDRFTLSQRVADYQSVLAALRTDQPDLFETITLFGGSEGGLAMEILATRIDADAIILLAGSVGTTFEEMVLAAAPPQAGPTIEGGFAEARANPDSGDMFSGHSLRFWADALDHRSSDYLLAMETPVLLIHGGRDPAAGAAHRPLLDLLAERGACHVTYWEFPSLDHGMIAPDGASRLDHIARRAAQWAQDPLPAC